MLFDGVCNLCNGFVQFVIARDPQGRFRFASLQSDFARDQLRRFGDRGSFSATVALIEGDRLHTRSTAALRILRGLRFPWRLAYVLIAVPRPIRDVVYDLVGRSRYRWFGQRETCMIPAPALRDRFLDG